MKWSKEIAAAVIAGVAAIVAALIAIVPPVLQSKMRQEPTEVTNASGSSTDVARTPPTAPTSGGADRVLLHTSWQGTQINATGLEGPLHVEFRDNSEALVRAYLYSGIRPGPPLGLSEEEMARHGWATVRCNWITDAAGSSVKIDCPRQNTLESNGGVEVPRVLYDLKLQGLSMECTKTYPESGRTSKCKLNKI